MDIIITYVDGNDPEWQKDYASVIGQKALAKRYRDWGTLPYLFRGIEECMPFIKNVFLVVARESQIPTWINRDTVKVVLHKDFIPQEFLPTFSASAIEMFLHLIKDLDEEYIYFNDDLFPLMPCHPTDFFRNGKAAAYMACHLFTFGNLFRRFVRGSDRMARRAADLSRRPYYIRPQHTCQPMLRSVCAELYDRHKDEIHASVTPLREPHNYNQYVYKDYAYFTGHTFHQRISNRHFSLAVASADKIRRAITHPTHQIACINDVEMSDEKFRNLHTAMHEAFQERFPRISKYELPQQDNLTPIS